jgi:CubicO group peptidase (beta-lactamase class C family)
MRLTPLIVLALVLTSSTPALAQDLRSAVDSFVARQIAADQFSGVVAVVRNGDVVYQRAAGFANRERNIPVTTETKLQIASMTKLFTNIAIRQLEQAGKLSLADTVGKFLPDYPNETVRRKVTVEQLLRHRSGIGSFWNDRWMATRASVRTVRDYLQLFQTDSLLFAPGTSEAYSNGGYVVLGAIIERVSGQSYHDYLREHVFRPAGMTNTVAFERNATIANAAIGYTRQNVRVSPPGDQRLAGTGPRPGYDSANAPASGSRMRILGPDGRELSPSEAQAAMARRAAEGGPRAPNSDLQPGVSGPAGDHYSTAGDFIRLAAALRSYKLLDSTHTAALFGTSYDTRGDFRSNGGGPGVNGEFSMYPNGDVMIVLSNYDPPSGTTIAQFIRSLLRPAPARPTTPETRAPEQVTFSGSRAEIPLTRRNGFYYVDVLVNGRPFHFTLETGANFILVGNRVARALGLPIDTTQRTGGIVMRPGMEFVRGRIDSLAVAGVTFRGFDARVTSLFDNGDFDGIISLPFLRDLLWTMDLANSRLVIERGSLPAPNGRDVVAMAGQDAGGRLDFMMSLGGQSQPAVMDTRYADWIMTNDSLLPKIPLATPVRRVGTARGPSLGTFEMRGARLAGAVTFGRYSVPQAPLVFRDRGGTIVGVNLLEQFVITVDQRNGRLRFARPDSAVIVPALAWETAAVASAPATPPTRTFGFRMAARGNRLFVVMLDSTSAAAKAGVRENDEVVEFEGVPSAQMNPEIFRAALARGTPAKFVILRDGKRLEFMVESQPVR